MPCLNESERVGKVIRSVRELLPQADIVVVDDVSSDTSVSEAEHAGATVLRHGCNLGYGAALETGYLYAAQANYDVVLQMDADGQHLATELPTILAPILDNNADVVIGSRYMGGLSPQATTPFRHFVHRIFSAIIRAITGLHLSDPTSGFQALNEKAISFLSSGVFPCDYPDSDVIIMEKLTGLRIMEVPVVMKNRTGGKSMHSGLKPLYYAGKMMLSIFLVLLNYRQWKLWQKRNHLCTYIHDNS